MKLKLAVVKAVIDGPAAVGEGVPVKVEQLEALDAEHEAGPVEGVDQLQLHPEVLLGEVVEHPGVDEALHEGGSVLGQPEGGQPVVPDPLVVHVPVRQGGSGGERSEKGKEEKEQRNKI